MFPELPPVLLGDPRGGTGGGIFSLITTAFCRSGGNGAPPDGICGAGFCFFDLPLIRASIGLPGLVPVLEGSALFAFAVDVTGPVGVEFVVT